MIKCEFTPGPWTTRRNAEIDKIINIHDRRNDPIANVASGFVWMPREEGEANAHLISAAPDMYEACKTMMDALNKLPRGLPDSTFTEPYFIMREAIAKAEMESDEAPCLTKK